MLDMLFGKQQNGLHPHKTQEKVFKKLLAKGKKTRFGKEHSFEKL
jgi:hypothetical protein